MEETNRKQEIINEILEAELSKTKMTIKMYNAAIKAVLEEDE